MAMFTWEDVVNSIPFTKKYAPVPEGGGGSSWGSENIDKKGKVIIPELQPKKPEQNIIDWIMNNWQLSIVGVVVLLVFIRD